MGIFDSGVRPIIDEWLLAESRKKRDYKEYWSASQAGYCMRKVIFDRMGVTPVATDADARKQRVFTAGHVFHSWIQEITKKAGISIAQELELIDKNLMIKGHIDDLIQTTLKGDLILYDYKTQNSRAFSYKRPLSHYHKMQLGTYMIMLRDYRTLPKTYRQNFNPLEVKEARILKISKDDLRMSEDVLLWSPDLEKEVVGYWKTIQGYWNNKTLPKCTCADVEGGFMAKELYNPYFFNGEPCSLEWYERWKKENKNANDRTTH